jgi:hypothetical protein
MIEKEEASALIRSLWHKQDEPVAIGCQGCPDRLQCGGIKVAASIFSCMDHCTCEDQASCSKVCPNKPDFVARVHEVRGFGFEDIERRKPIPLLDLPTHAHILFTYPKVRDVIRLPAAAVPLSSIFDRSGLGGMALTRQQVERRFRLAPNTPLILSGVELDRKIEKYWGVTRGRSEMITGIRALNPLIVTTPNYSVVLDAPRHDAMHSLKRILLAWSELHDAGIRTAVHLNAVTDRDYDRMTEFLRIHTEVRAVSIEFETGAATEVQGLYHAEQLDRMVQRLGRAPHLVFRGDARWLPALRRSFPTSTILNGAASVRTRKRRRAEIKDGVLRWASTPTPIGAPLDELLQHNFAQVGTWLDLKIATAGLAARGVLASSRPQQKQGRSEVGAEGHDQTGQLSLL